MKREKLVIEWRRIISVLSRRERLTYIVGQACSSLTTAVVILGMDPSWFMSCQGSGFASGLTSERALLAWKGHIWAILAAWVQSRWQEDILLWSHTHLYKGVPRHTAHRWNPNEWIQMLLFFFFFIKCIFRLNLEMHDGIEIISMSVFAALFCWVWVTWLLFD